MPFIELLLLLAKSNIVFFKEASYSKYFDYRSDFSIGNILINVMYFVQRKITTPLLKVHDV